MQRIELITRGGALINMLFLLISGCASSGEEDPIDLWYGNEQHFRGSAQRQLNILGNTRADSLLYRLNAGAWQTATLGPDTHRLAAVGDFNIDIDTADLIMGPNTLELLAHGDYGRHEESVTLHFEHRRWPLQYAIRWDTVSRLTDVAQIVDGHWSITEDGLQNQDVYYDRVVALGDGNWRNYEISATLRFDSVTPPSPGPPNFNVSHAALAVRWPGHDEDGRQPDRKWHPLGATAEFRLTDGNDSARWRIFDGDNFYRESPPEQYRTIDSEGWYRLRHRVVTTGDDSTHYAVRLWPADKAEPKEWDLVATEGPGDVGHGSALILAHHTQITVSTTEISERPATLDLAAREIYGHGPDRSRFTTDLSWKGEAEALPSGKGLRSLAELTIQNESGQSRKVDLLMYHPPQGADSAVGTVLYLNFLGNAAQVEDEAVPLPRHPVYRVSSPERGFDGPMATERVRGVRSGRFPLDSLLSRGYAVVMAAYQDFAADEASHFYDLADNFYGLDTSATGAIAVWAEGFRWLGDVAEQQDRFHSGPLLAVGHSRIGKAVLYAAAQDERFSATLVNGSGCGGATLFARAEGETIRAITTNFPYWFRSSFRRYRDRDDQLPQDQDALLRAVAPRTLVVSAAEDDGWADPLGELRSIRAASPAWGLPLATFPDQLPPAGNILGTKTLRFHYRSGGHDLTASDWSALLSTAEEER